MRPENDDEAPLIVKQADFGEFKTAVELAYCEREEQRLNANSLIGGFEQNKWFYCIIAIVTVILIFVIFIIFACVH